MPGVKSKLLIIVFGLTHTKLRSRLHKGSLGVILQTVKADVKQGTAFWPCGSCRLNCKSDCIRRDACKQWFHAKCENQAAADLDFLKNASVTYTYNDCVAIELGTSPYNYLYELTSMKQVGIKINACLLHVSISYILLRLDE